MRIKKLIKKILLIFWKNLIKEDDIVQDFKRNFSEQYSYLKDMNHSYVYGDDINIAQQLEQDEKYLTY